MSTAATRRLTREVWIGAALNILATEAVDEVAVERLAEQLGVTKAASMALSRSSQLITAALRNWALEGPQTASAAFSRFLTLVVDSAT
ncbi:MAG TPA: hypothetical protein VGC03_10165 [Acidimicrobiia bacterium]